MVTPGTGPLSDGWSTLGGRTRLLATAVGVGLLFALPLVLSSYALYLLASIFEAALFALSLNLILGYGGLLQLSQATFYGIGAYTAALLLTRTGLSFWLTLAAAPLAAVVASVVIGWFCVRLRQIYFAILTLAIGQLIWAVADRWYALTGGDNGINSIPLPALLRTTQGGYYLALALLVGAVAVMYWIVRSPFGLTLQAIRDNPMRSAGVGVDVQRHRLTAFVLSGGFAGLAGVVHVVVAGFVGPFILNWTMSAEVLIMVLLGGIATFIGPAFGAAVLVLLSLVLGSYTNYWLLVLGAVLVVLTLFLPQGMVGFVEERLGRRRPSGGAGVG